MKNYPLLFLILLAFHLSCKESPSDAEKFTGNGRLDINGSVDSVKIGELPERVKELFGEPQSWFTGDFDGFGYEYDFGRVTFMKIPIDSIYSATWIELNENYEGETIEGIGMGSKRSEVLKYIRTPDKTNHVQNDSSLTYIDAYIITENEIFHNTVFFFYYNDVEILDKIKMNYFLQIDYIR